MVEVSRQTACPLVVRRRITAGMTCLRRLPEGLDGVTCLHALIASAIPEEWADLPASEAATRFKIGIETERGPWLASLIATRTSGHIPLPPSRRLRLRRINVRDTPVQAHAAGLTSTVDLRADAGGRSTEPAVGGRRGIAPMGLRSWLDSATRSVTPRHLVSAG